MPTDFSKVYLFLAKQEDWKTKADSLGNKDGVVSKNEFTELMKDFEWDGENITKSDLINQFWQSIDTKTSGNNDISSKSDYNTLNSSEIANVELKLKAYKILDNYFNTNISVPDDVILNTSGWKNSVLAGLSARLEEHLAENSKTDNIEKILTEATPQIVARATADYCANEFLASTDIAEKFKELTDYAYGSDEILQGLINSYVKEVNPNTPATEIKQAIQELLNAYLATARLSDTPNIDLLKQYGYEIDDSTKLNDLQKSMLRKELTTKKQNNAENPQEVSDSEFEDYVEKVLDETLFIDFAQVNTSSTTMIDVDNKNLNFGELKDTVINGLTVNINGSSEHISTDVNLAQLYNSKLCIKMGEGRINNALTDISMNLNLLVNTITNACSANGADKDALTTAAYKILSLYSQALFYSIQNYGQGANTTAFQYENEVFSSVTNGEGYFYSNGSFAAMQDGTKNQLGLQANFSKFSNKVEFQLNPRCLMDLFNKFYKSALTDS